MNHQELYDKIYQNTIDTGCTGWGGNNRIAKNEEQFDLIISKKLIPKKGTVLEAGCGEGHLCRRFADYGFAVTGIDISSVAIDWAKRKQSLVNHDIQYITDDLSAKTFSLGIEFDLIVDGNCLHCIPEKKRKIFYKNVKDLLKSNGVFFISSLCSKTNQNIVLYEEDLPYRFIPSKETIMEEVESIGFLIKEHTVYERDTYNHIKMVLTHNQQFG